MKRLDGSFWTLSKILFTLLGGIIIIDPLKKVGRIHYKEKPLLTTQTCLSINNGSFKPPDLIQYQKSLKPSKKHKSWKCLNKTNVLKLKLYSGSLWTPKFIIFFKPSNYHVESSLGAIFSRFWVDHQSAVSFFVLESEFCFEKLACCKTIGGHFEKSKKVVIRYCKCSYYRVS